MEERKRNSLVPFSSPLKKCKKKIGRRLVCERKGILLLEGRECMRASSGVEIRRRMRKWDCECGK
jgi:hypothetical protein